MATRKAKSKYAYREKFPFMYRGRSSGIPRGCDYQIWWNVKPTGDYQADYDTGADHALTFWQVAGGRGGCSIDLAQIIFAMMEMCGKRPRLRGDKWGRQYSGIEIGFIRTICKLVELHTQLPDWVMRNRRIKSPNATWKPPRIRNARVGARLLAGLVASQRKLDKAQQAEIMKEAGAAVH